MASTALNSLIYGNLDILPGQSVTNGLGDLLVSNVAYVLSTTASTSVGSGSLQISGGAGIVGATYIGGVLNAVNTEQSIGISSGALVVSGGVGIAKDAYIGGITSILATVESTAFTNGALVVDGGIGIAKNLNLAGVLASENTTESTSSSTGSIITPGGVGIAKNIWIGGSTNSTGVINALSTAEATNSASGSLVVSGGVGIAKDVYIGDALTVTGVASFLDTTESTSVSSGSVLIDGGVGIDKSVYVGGLTRLTETSNATDISTGSLVVSGGVGIAKDTYVAGLTRLLNTVESTSTTTGSLVVSGGVGIAKTLYVGSNASIAGSVTITGDLTVNGTASTINSQVVSLTDNILMVNNGPSGTADSGVVNKRYQFANDTSSGDVVTNDTPFQTGNAQAGSATTITLAAGANGTNDYYAGWWVRITSGTGSGQVRRINTYNGTTKVATIYTSADQTANNYTPVEGLDFTVNPDATSVYSLYPTQYIAQIWKEATEEWTVGYTPFSPNYQTAVTLFGLPTVRFGSVKIEDILYTDSIYELTSSAGVTFGATGVNIGMDGEITGVVSINGVPAPLATTVVLADNDTATTVPIPTLPNYGTYLILVGDAVNTGAFASFLVSAANGAAGSVARVSSARSIANNVTLDLVWNAGSPPALKHRTAGGSGASVTYNLNVTRWA